MMRHSALPLVLMGLLSSSHLFAADEKPASSGRMVSVEIVIVQFDKKNDVDLNLDSDDKITARLAELEKQGQISQLTRLRLSTLEQQSAELFFIQRVGLATSRTVLAGRVASPVIRQLPPLHPQLNIQ